MQQKNKDRFRTRFCPAEYYVAHQEIFALWKSRLAHLTPVEKVQYWVILLTCLRRPKDWFGGAQPLRLSNSPQTGKNHISSSPLLSELIEGTPVQWPQKLSRELTLTEFLSSVRIKALPESVFRSLCSLSTGEYPLILRSDVPEPEEILAMQIAGQRVLSYNEDHELWPKTLYNHRDFLGFVIHDLIHADHFFRERAHRDGQLGFYRFVSSIFTSAPLQQLLQTNEKFKVGLEYIVSDMNSHPVHLFQTFHSLLFSSLKNDTLATALWHSWCRKPEIHPETSAALQNINSVNFNRTQALLVEEFCIDLGRKTNIHSLEK